MKNKIVTYFSISFLVLTIVAVAIMMSISTKFAVALLISSVLVVGWYVLLYVVFLAVPTSEKTVTLENKHIDELIEERFQARINKDFVLSDKIRQYLDEKLIFIFDMKDNFQEVWYLSEDYFKNIEKIEAIKKIKFNSKRRFVEYQIKEGIRAEKIFDACIYSMLSGSKQIKQTND